MKEYWQSNALQTYKDLGFNSFVRFPLELKLPRHLVAHIYAARSGHEDFASYHDRFNHIDSSNKCSSMALKSTRNI